MKTVKVKNSKAELTRNQTARKAVREVVNFHKRHKVGRSESKAHAQQSKGTRPGKKGRGESI